MSWPRCCRSVRRGVFKTRGNGSADYPQTAIDWSRPASRICRYSPGVGKAVRTHGDEARKGFRCGIAVASRIFGRRAVRYENNRFSRYVRKNFIRPSRIDGLLYSGGRAMSRTESSSLRLRYGAERDDRSWGSSSMRSEIPISKDC